MFSCILLNFWQLQIAHLMESLVAVHLERKFRGHNLVRGRALGILICPLGREVVVVVGAAFVDLPLKTWLGLHFTLVVEMVLLCKYFVLHLWIFFHKNWKRHPFLKLSLTSLYTFTCKWAFQWHLTNWLALFLTNWENPMNQNPT